METQSWFLLFVALFVLVAVLALIAWVRRPSRLDNHNPYVTGGDSSPDDGAIGRDRDMDLERHREADFDDER